LDLDVDLDVDLDSGLWTLDFRLGNLDWGFLKDDVVLVRGGLDVEFGVVTEAGLKARTKRFALRVLRLTASLPGTPEGFVLRRQLARSATAVGAHYRSACRGRSRADFASKLAIAEEEADESGYWLELILDAGMLERSLVDPLLQEANELTAILAASVRTVKIQNRKP
jgi:four helix bundle protein